jgi:hypothetical protein
MRFKTLMIIKAVVCLFFGIAFIFSPIKLVSIFGVTLSPGAVFPAWEYGAALFGNLVLTWYSRNAAESEARLAIIRALFVYDAVGVIISVMAIIKGILNPLGWLIVALYLFFTLGFGYFLTTKSRMAEAIS